MNNRLYIVIPCFNEEEVLQETASRLLDKVSNLISKDTISEDSRILFVDDGSTDSTWSLIINLHSQKNIFSGIKLSKNKGHQNALLAGLMTAMDNADMIISMDADLQDDINAIDEMIQKYHEGCDIVYGVRSSRSTDSFFKRFTAESFYRLMNHLGVSTVFNHADYRLLSKRALHGLAGYTEVNMFLRGIIPMIGYKTDIVYYERGERFAGESKYPFSKMLSFAIEGITSLSIKPIRMITSIGFFIFFMSIIILIYSFIRHYIGETIQGWTTLMVSIWAIGGLILLSLGIVGEYVGKIYMETKGRPRYIIEEYLDN